MADDSNKPVPDNADHQVPEPKPAVEPTPRHADDSTVPGNSEQKQVPGLDPENESETSAIGEPAQVTQAQKRRAKREKLKARSEPGNEATSDQPDATTADSAASVSSVPAPPMLSPNASDSSASPSSTDASAAAQAAQLKIEKRRAKRGKAHAAAERESRQGGPKRKVAAIAGSTLIVLLSAIAVTAGSLNAQPPHNSTLPSAVTSLPAGDSVYTCATVPQLLRGVEGTDPQFAPGAEDVSTTIRTAVVSDLAKRIPGSGLGEIGQEESRRLTDRLDENEARQARGSDAEGLTGREAAVQNTENLDPLQVLRIQPLGELPSMGSGVRSYQAQDGDLAGLAASTCVGAESNWRFTGLQTTTGASSVLHLANPTSTTAQVAVELRGADGLIDTSTLQEIVVAPGTSRAIVLAGYAQGQESVSANIRSVGGKITATVQQSALRGLTPSGVDFVAANAPAANTQVIPGVWIDEKSNIDELTSGDGADSLVPQLHVSATGSQGAGFTVKVLDSNGEVAVDLGANHAVSSDATSVVDLRALSGGRYSIVVEADNPVTAAVRMVRGQNPEDSSDTAWAVSTSVLNGNQVAPVSAHGNATFTIAAAHNAASVNVIVISQDGSMADAQTLEVPAGTSRDFNPRDVSENAAAVLFQGDSNAYIGQSILGSDRSVSWAPTPPANGSREGIVVNVVG